MHFPDHKDMLAHTIEQFQLSGLPLTIGRAAIWHTGDQRTDKIREIAESQKGRDVTVFVMVCSVAFMFMF